MNARFLLTCLRVCPALAFGWLLGIGTLAAQSAGGLGRFDVGPAEPPPAIDSPLVPLVPNRGVVAARPVPVDPAVAQAEGLNQPPPLREPVSDLTLMQILSGSQDFTTFVLAAKAAGFEEMLRSQGPLTVIAPNNAAFAALPAGVLHTLMLPENRQPLRRLIAYHLIPQKLPAAQIIPRRYDTVLGEPLEFLAGGGGNIFVRGGNIIQTDIIGRNGVIHTVDRVLIPGSVVLESFAVPVAPAP